MDHDQRIAELHATHKNGRVEPNIYFVSASSRFRVKIGRKWHGTFWTLEGARVAKAKIREERGDIDRAERIKVLEEQLVSLNTKLEDLKNEKPN